MLETYAGQKFSDQQSRKVKTGCGRVKDVTWKANGTSEAENYTSWYGEGNER